MRPSEGAGLLMAKKDRSLPEPVERTIRTARVSGMSERAIYESLRETLDTPPSYRDVRASLSRSNLRYRSQATAARHARDYPEAVGGERPMRESAYLERLRSAQENTRLSREDAKRQGINADEAIASFARADKDALDERYVLGYLARSGADPDDIADEDLRDRLIHIYDGQGSG